MSHQSRVFSAFAAAVNVVATHGSCEYPGVVSEQQVAFRVYVFQAEVELTAQYRHEMWQASRRRT